jgi:hypothetical protein
MADLTQFDLGSAARVARVVRTVEGQGPKAKPLTFDTVFEQSRQRAFRVCTFTGSWPINSPKVLTFQNVTTTPNTVSSRNQLFTIGDACETQVAYIGKIGTDWHLLNVQHHETAVFVNVTLTTAALEFTRHLVWIPYPGQTSTLSIPLTTETACSST